MTFPAGMGGDGQLGWGEDGWDTLDVTFLFQQLPLLSLLLAALVLLLLEVLCSEPCESD